MTWEDRAACKSDPPRYDLFFPEPDDVETAAKAIDICNSCPVRRECLADALSWPSSMDLGIRGGLTAEQRDELRMDMPEPEPYLPPHPGHGSTAGYTYEIRHLGESCEACRDAEARYRQALLATTTLEPDDPRHGRRRGYRLGCRCLSCCNAEAEFKAFITERRRRGA